MEAGRQASGANINATAITAGRSRQTNSTRVRTDVELLECVNEFCSRTFLPAAVYLSVSHPALQSPPLHFSYLFHSGFHLFPKEILKNFMDILDKVKSTDLLGSFVQLKVLFKLSVE